MFGNRFFHFPTFPYKSDKSFLVPTTNYEYFNDDIHNFSVYLCKKNCINIQNIQNKKFLKIFVLKLDFLFLSAIISTKIRKGRTEVGGHQYL